MTHNGTARRRDPRVRDVPPVVRERVRELLDRVGCARAAAELGVSRYVVMSVAAGEPVMAGTLALLERTEPKGVE